MKILYAALLVLGLGACATARPADPAAMPTHAMPVADAATLLTQYHWQLDAAVDGAGAPIGALLAHPKGPLSLTFNARGMSVQNACNAMHAEYRLAGGTLELRDLLSTTMACADPALNQLEAAVKDALRGTLALAIDTAGTRPRLTLTTASGQRLGFSGIPTAATRYGGAGHVLFLEVAAQSIPCPQGAPGARCLDVREVHYSAQGVREGQPGPWHALDQPIEGYTHRPGTRNVLRVTRYAIARPAAHGAHEAYVLDMVVESAIAPAGR